MCTRLPLVDIHVYILSKVSGDGWSVMYTVKSGYFQRRKLDFGSLHCIYIYIYIYSAGFQNQVFSFENNLIWLYTSRSSHLHWLLTGYRHGYPREAIEYTLQHFNFFTVVVCGLGFIGNASSLFVLLRHQKGIAGFRPLLALAVADMGLVGPVYCLAYRGVPYNRLHTVHAVSRRRLLNMMNGSACIGTTIVTVSTSPSCRYLSSAYPMLLLKMNYTKLQAGIISSVFPAVLLISLPHLLGFIVTYHHGSHSMIVPCHFKIEICTLLAKFHGRYCSDSQNVSHLGSFKIKTHSTAYRYLF